MTAAGGRRDRRRPRIRRRLALMTAAVTTTVVLAFCIPLAIFISSVAYDRAIDGAEVQARSLAAELVGSGSRVAVEVLVDQANGATETPATVYIAGGGTAGLAGTSPGAARGGGGVRPPPIPLPVRAGRSATTAGAAGSRLVWEPVRGRSVATAVMVSVPASQLGQGVVRDWVLLFGGGALLILVAVGLADGLGRSIVRPTQQLEVVTRGLRDGDLDRRVVPAGPYEIAEVGRAVNELADRIDGLLEGARLAAADLGHRLRTPLTALHLDVEALADGHPARGALEDDLVALEKAVDRLIREVRGSPPAPGHTGAMQAICGRMAFWGVLARSQGRQFTVDVPKPEVEVALRRDELEAAIDALLSNVFAHTPEGTAFRIGLRPCGSGGGEWVIVVEDDGPGRMHDRAKLGTRGTGTGLGLDIVRRTAERAGGKARFGRSDGGGFRAELRLPEVSLEHTAQTSRNGT